MQKYLDEDKVWYVMILAWKQYSRFEDSEISDNLIKQLKMASLEVELDSVEENLLDDILSLSTADIQARLGPDFWIMR